MKTEHGIVDPAIAEGLRLIGCTVRWIRRNWSSAIDHLGMVLMPHVERPVAFLPAADGEVLLPGSQINGILRCTNRLLLGLVAMARVAHNID